MTRRDYCQVCETLVCDDDPMCCKCYKSLHVKCVTLYNAKSRIMLCYQKDTKLTNHIFNQFLRDLLTNNLIDNLMNEEEEEEKRILDIIKQTDFIEDTDDEYTGTLIKDFYYVYNDKDPDYICYMCHKGIVLEY